MKISNSFWRCGFGVCCLLGLSGCFVFDASPVPNSKPIAAVDVAAEVAPGETVLLDGAGSSDADLDDLMFRWEQVAGEGDPVELRDADAKVASFVAPARGQLLYFRLTVNDGIENSDPAVTAVRVNGRPIAEAGVPLEVLAGSPVLLGGGGSDPDGDSIAGYAWSVVSAPPGGGSCLMVPSSCLVGMDSPAPTFIPPVKGDYLLSLTVSDDRQSSLPDTTLVRALNRRPRAQPGSTQASVLNGQPLDLNASASTDPDGDAITGFHWQIQSQPASAIGRLDPPDGSVANPVLIPQGKGAYYLSLVVTDADGAESEPGILRVDASNNVPVANAGEDTAVLNGIEVFLVGAGVDPDGDSFSYTWLLLDAPPDGEVMLLDPGSRVVHFVPTRKSLVANPASCGPNQCYQLGLVVSDGTAASQVDSLVVVSLNRAPVAVGSGVQVMQSANGRLDAWASFDPDGDDITWYRWEQVEGDDVTSGAGFFSDPSVEFLVDSTGVVAFELTVGDGETESLPQRIAVAFDRINHAPVISVASPFAVAKEGEPFTLDASATTDPEGDPISVVWTRISGDESFPRTLVGTAPALLAPPLLPLLRREDSDNSATYEVVATDGEATSLPQPLTVFVAPGDGFVIVSDRPEADDTATPDCGSVEVPCRNLTRAIELIDPWGGPYIGDGRNIIMTEGQWGYEYGSGTGSTVVFQWRGAMSLFAGRDPVSFAPVGRTQLRVTNACATPIVGIRLGPEVGPDVELRGVRLITYAGCAALDIGVDCDACAATIRDSEIVVTEGSPGMTDRVGVRVSKTAGALALYGVGVNVAAAVTSGRGAWLLDGSRLDMIDSSILLGAAEGPGGDGLGIFNRAVDLAGGSSAMLERSVLSVRGVVTTGGGRSAVIAANGVLSLTNSVIENTSGPDGHGIDLTNGTAVVINNTILGGGNTSGSGCGLRLEVAAYLMNNLIDAFPFALWLDTPDALGSRLQANQLGHAGTSIAYCSGAEVADVGEINGSGITCNPGAAENTGNIVGSCPLVNPSASNYHLNVGVTNDCRDKGIVASPVGQAPDDDIDSEPRPDASGMVDIGADEHHDD